MQWVCESWSKGWEVRLLGVKRMMMSKRRIHAALTISFLPVIIYSAQHSNGNGTKFSFANFAQNNSEQLIYMGNANLSAGYGYINLTPDLNSGINVSSATETAYLLQCNGRVLYHKQIPMWPASFTTVFTILIEKITAIRNFNGDGIAFILVPENKKDILTKSSGAFMGLFNQSTDGNTTGQLAIELDTFHNEFDEESGNHVGIDTAGIKSDASASTNERGIDIQAGRAVQVRIDYDGWTKSLQIYARYADNTSAYRSLLNHTIELEKTVPRTAYVGFSATTGNSFQIQRLVNWNFSSLMLPDSSLNYGVSGGGVKVWLLVGTIAVGLFMAGILASWFAVKRLKRENGRAAIITLGRGRFVGELAIIHNAPQQFSYSQLAAATNNFSEAELLGTGGFGGVFRGNLNAGGREYVAVKRISATSKQGEREFISEINTIGRLRHRNLVQLQGWCHERDELLLVYDYMPNGSLDKFIYDRSGQPPLNWPLRHKILYGLASALLYLHEEWEQRIIHRDVKPSNVMLDQKFNARLGDFGLARLIEHDDQSPGVTTLLAGTLGYVAPECSYTGKATAESDVFSFGIVLLEVATGRRVVERNSPLAERNLVDWVWGLYSQGCVLQCADPKLEGTDYDEEEIWRVLILGLACSHPDPQLRPTTRQAIQMLMNRDEELPQLPLTRPLAIYVALPTVRAICSESTLSSNQNGDTASNGLVSVSSGGSITSSTLHHGR